MRERKPKLIIPVEIWNKIMAYTTICHNPIGGIGTIEIGSLRRNLRVTDAVIIRQEVIRRDDGTKQICLDSTAIEEQELWPHKAEEIHLRWTSVLDRDPEPIEVRDIYSGQDWFVYLETTPKGIAKARLERYHPYRESIPIEVEVDYIADETTAALYECQIMGIVSQRLSTTKGKKE